MARAPEPTRPALARLLPGLAQLRSYQRRWLRGDVVAGVTVSAYLIPQVMAYAEVAGLPAPTGLWALVAASVVYAVLGPSRQLSVGPESSTALMTAVAVGSLVAATGNARYAQTAALLALTVGLLCVVCWVCRLGFVANLLSRPVLVGYMSGIAVLMVVSQLGKVTGIDVPRGSTFAELRAVGRDLDQVHLPTAVVALVVLVALPVLARWLPRLPGPLVVMLASAFVVAVSGLDERGVAVIGQVPRGLPAPALPDLGGVAPVPLVLAALGVMVVAYSDNVVTGRAFAAKRHESVDPDQEFLGLGAANLAAGLLHGFPVSSSGSRTVIGDAAGSRTQLYSLVAVAAVLLATTVFGPVLAAFPSAALGALVIYAATKLVDLDALRRLAHFRRSELVLALATTAGVVVLDVLYGVVVAVALSILDLLRRISRPHDGVLGYVPGIAGMHDVDDYATGRQVVGLVVYRYDAPLFFANAENFRHRALAAVAHAPAPVEWFVLNAEANVELDLTAVDALADLRRTLTEQGIVFALARVKHEVEDSLRRAGFLSADDEHLVFMTLPTAIQAYAQWYRGRHGTLPSGLPQQQA